MTGEDAVVREGLVSLFHAGQTCGCDKCAVVRERVAALDRLVAERDDYQSDFESEQRRCLMLDGDRLAAEAEVARLKEFMACADTPLMRDVLAERDRLRELCALLPHAELVARLQTAEAEVARLKETLALGEDA